MKNRPRKDLTGLMFHRWTVLGLADGYHKNMKWKCHCVCGKEQLVFGNSLLYGKSKSCGCVRSELYEEAKMKNAARICSIEGCGRKYAHSGICGMHYQRKQAEIKRGPDGKKQSNFIDMIGFRTGFLEVVSRHPINSSVGSATWNCKCDCGNIVRAIGRSLRKGIIKSCGCWKSIRHVEARQRMQLPQHSLLKAAKNRAKNRGMEFNIDLSDVPVPEICPLLGIPLAKSTDGYASPNSPTIDRIDQDKGYVKGNVWVVSWRANTLKNDASLNELETLVKSLKHKIEENDGTFIHQLQGNTGNDAFVF